MSENKFIDRGARAIASEDLFVTRSPARVRLEDGLDPLSSHQAGGEELFKQNIQEGSRRHEQGDTDESRSRTAVEGAERDALPETQASDQKGLGGGRTLEDLPSRDANVAAVSRSAVRDDVDTPETDVVTPVHAGLQAPTSVSGLAGEDAHRPVADQAPRIDGQVEQPDASSIETDAGRVALTGAARLVAPSPQGGGSPVADPADPADPAEPAEPAEPKAEPIRGTYRGDTLSGGAGNDEILGLGGNDRIDAGDGDDIIYGGDGRDTLNGGAGDDLFIQNRGDDYDRLDGGAGHDTLLAGEDNDMLGLSGDFSAANRIETLDGGENGARIQGGWSSNRLDFSEVELKNIDSIHAGHGNDTLLGSSASDQLFGDEGNDLLIYRYQQGGDSFDGGAGHDTLMIEMQSAQLASNPNLAQAVAGVVQDIENNGEAVSVLLGLNATGIEGVDIRVDARPMAAEDILEKWGEKPVEGPSDEVDVATASLLPEDKDDKDDKDEGSSFRESDDPWEGQSDDSPEGWVEAVEATDNANTVGEGGWTDDVVSDGGLDDQAVAALEVAPDAGLMDDPTQGLDPSDVLENPML